MVEIGEQIYAIFDFLFDHLLRNFKLIFSAESLLITNIFLVMFFTAFGDIIQQKQNMIRGLIFKHNWMRTRNQTLAASPIGLIYHYWYSFLDGYFPGTTVWTIVTKVCLDLVLMSPIAWTVYFALLTIFDKGSWGLFVNRAFKKGGKLYLAEWVVWPPAQIFNFYFLSTKFRVLCDMCVQLVFDCYASYLMYDEL